MVRSWRDHNEQSNHLFTTAVVLQNNTTLVLYQKITQLWYLSIIYNYLLHESECDMVKYFKIKLISFQEPKAESKA